MKKLLFLLGFVLSLNTWNISYGQTKVCTSQVPTLTAQGDLTPTGAVDTSFHTGATVYTAAQMPLVSPIDTTTHTAKTADSVDEKIACEPNLIGLQVDITQLVHNATGADSTTVTFYGTKTGGNWQYPNGGWVQLQTTTISNVTTLQSVTYDVNSTGIGGNPWTHYLVVVKVGELYFGTSAKWETYLIWR